MEKVKKPDIPEETMQKMWEFFLKTSIPRIIEAERKQKEAK